jgi:hypothetical protein
MSLSFKDQCLTTYLQPLVDKHEAGQRLVYEDLTSSWADVDELLQQQETKDVAVAVSNFFLPTLTYSDHR